MHVSLVLFPAETGRKWRTAQRRTSLSILSKPRAPLRYLVCVCLRAWAYHFCSFCALGSAVCVFGGGGLLSGGVWLISLGFLGFPSYHHFFPRGLPTRYALIPSLFRSAVLLASCSSCVLWWCPHFLRRWRPLALLTRIDGSRIHVRCSPRLGGELLCAPKRLRHYHSPDDLSWDEWRLSDIEVERIDLENAASPEEADELEEMTAEEVAVDGYYVVAGIARHDYKQGWKFLTLWDGYGFSEATWEPISAFIQPDGSINPIFRSYLVENNEGQLLTRAETMSQRKKRS